ncbi:MAG: hypothetical protein ACK5IM_08140, partial [Demequina sp.]
MTDVAAPGTLQSTIDALLPRVHAHLDAYVAHARDGMPVAAPDYSRLWDHLGAQFVGGKDLRPSLTIAGYLGLGGDDPDAVIP